jgi:hypothetical protein
VNPWQRLWFLPVLALVLLALAVWTTDPGLAALLGGIAAGVAAVFLVLVLLEHVRFEGIPLPDSSGDALVALTRSFRGGRFGREEILAHLDGLDLALGQPIHRPPEAQESLLRAPEAEFLDYVEGRIQRVEGLT